MTSKKKVGSAQRKKEKKERRRANSDSIVASDSNPIGSENIGNRMLMKMGWSPGLGLGVRNHGIVEPVEAVVRGSRKGLGS